MRGKSPFRLVIRGYMYKSTSLLRFLILAFVVVLSFLSMKVINAKAMANVDVESINPNQNYKVNNKSKGYKFKVIGDGLTTIFAGSLSYRIYLEN